MHDGPAYAEWFGGAGTVAAVWFGAVTWFVDRRRSLTLTESEQARKISGVLEWKEVAGKRELRATIRNTSDLPVRSLNASVTARSGGTAVHSPVHPSLAGGEVWVTRINVGGEADWNLAIQFEDDNGIKWRKVTGEGPKRVTTLAEGRIRSAISALRRALCRRLGC